MLNIFDNKYPYTDFHEMNLDWVIAKIMELEGRMDDLTSDILAKANEYTDTQLATYQAQVDALRVELTNMVNGLEDDFDNLKVQINQSLLQMEIKLDNLQNELEADIAAVNQRTDLAIEQNNLYILGQLEQFLSGIQVLNALTGTYMSIQNMFNYLCTLHSADGITYTALAGKNNTYTQLSNYGMTYTQLAMNGSNIIQ